jgi:hypothetical protein
MDTGHTARYVWFNDGTASRYATVIKEHPNGALDLVVEGETGVKHEVPHREPSDYGPEGGGDTWHL